MPGVIDDVRHPPKNATVKNFTSTDILGPIKFDSPNGGKSNSRIKKNVNSPFNYQLNLSILSLPPKESLSLSHLRESATKLAETDPGLVGPYVAAVIKELNKINQVGRDRINPVTNQEGHM